MTGCGARVFLIEVAINDAIERHGAGAGGEDGGDDEEKSAPAGPAAGFTSGHCHRCQGKRESKNCVRQLDELAPFEEVREHL